MNLDQKWSCGTVASIIKNPTYRGARVYNRLKKKGIGKFAPRFWVKDQSNWTIIENAHAPIVNPEEWRAANPSAKNSDIGRLGRDRFDSPYVLSGLIICPKCNFNFSGSTQTIGVPGKRRKRRTYTDSGYVNKGPTVCTSFSIGADKLEAALVSSIEKWSTSSTVREIFERCVDEGNKSKASIHRDRVEKDRTDILRLNNQILALVALAEKGVKLDEVADRMKQLEQERLLAEQRVKEAATAKPPKEEIAKALDEARAYFREFMRNWREGTNSERKSLIRQVVDRIVIDRERRVAKCYIQAMPKSVGRTLDNLLENSRTQILTVPPTGFEPVLQA